MAHYPGSTFRPVASHGGRASSHMGLVVHITTNDFDPYGFFSNPANEASSNYWFAADGAASEYVDPDLCAWAQANGNGIFVSAETSGRPGTPLTDAQITGLARLYAWGHATYGWPFQLTNSPSTPGLGWHGMGGASWGGHSACPGDARRAQLPTVLARAVAISAGRPASSVPPVAAQPAPAPAPAPSGLSVDGVPGPMTIAALQRAVGSPADGQLGPNTWRAIQARCGAVADGVPGPNTWRAVQRHVGSPADGVPGPNTWRAIQAALNAGRF